MKNDFKAKYLRQLPSIGKMIESPELSDSSNHNIITQSLREIIDSRKSFILSADNEEQLTNLDLSPEKIILEAKKLINEKSRMNSRYAINATGDVLHEKLGRSPLNELTQKAIMDVIKGYSVSRDVSDLLASLMGAESGLVVNNGTAGLMLALNTICNGKDAIVSRGELVDDDVRLTDIIELSGVKLVSVGTTNKTHLGDYANAVTENTGAILKASRSNFHIVGFAEQVGLNELVALVREINPPNPLLQRGNEELGLQRGNNESVLQRGNERSGSQSRNEESGLQKGNVSDIPIIDYIINGCITDLTQLGFPEEPYIALSVKMGADIVCFNGNRLFGGCQAGLIVGKEKYILAMRENLLYKALTPDKMAVSALEATLRSYIDTDRILENNLTLKFLRRSYNEIASMTMILAEKLTNALNDLAEIIIRDGYSHIESLGMPSEKFPTKLIEIKPLNISLKELVDGLSIRDVPIFVLSDGDQIIIDLRVVRDDEIGEIATALIDIFS